MILFVDASALVAIITSEPDADILLERLNRYHVRVTSPIAVYEAALADRRVRTLTIPDGEAIVFKTLSDFRIEILPVDPAAGTAALSAFARFGKGEGHPARLNMGDCFAFGMMKRRGGALFFKGGDFAETGVGSI